MSLTAECDANTGRQQKSVNETYIEPGHQCQDRLPVQEAWDGFEPWVGKNL